MGRLERPFSFSKIGRMPIDSIGQPEVMMCLAPIWTEKREANRRLAQRIKIVLDVARSKGFRSGETPVKAIKDSHALPRVKAKSKHHKAMRWQECLPSMQIFVGARRWRPRP